MTTLDNDGAVYDSFRDNYYAIDPNGPAQLAEINLSTGAHANRGSISTGSSFAMAYGADADAIYIRAGGTNNELWSATGADAASGTSISFTNLGAISGDSVSGLAFTRASVPEPSCIALLSLAVTGCLATARDATNEHRKRTPLE